MSSRGVRSDAPFPKLLFLALFVSLASAVVTPISASKIGRHTIYNNAQSVGLRCGGFFSLFLTGAQSGACNYGTLLSPMGPGFLQIAALNDYTVDGFGFQGSQACGTCYEVTGIAGTTKLMVTDSCPGCPVLQPHFDMSPEAAAQVDNGAPGGGFTAVTFRKVTCGFAGNVIVQEAAVSSLFFLRLQIAHHNTPLKGTVTVQETGKAPQTVTRTTFGFWDWNPNNAVFPITITIEDIYGSVITAVWPSHNPGQIVDTGKQFLEPPAGTGGGESNCVGGVCPAPLINSGQLVIFEDTTFPQRTPDWLPLTQHGWMWFSGALTPISSPVFSGAMSGSTTLGSFGEIHIGCNVQSAKAVIAFVTLAIRMRPGVTSPGLQWWSGSGAHQTMTPAPNGSAWTQYWLPIAGNANVPGTVFSDLQIQHMSSSTMEYLVDSFYFVLSNSALSTPCQPFNYPQPSQPAGVTTAAVTTVAATTATATTAAATTAAATTAAATTAAPTTTRATTVPVTTVAATTVAATTVPITTVAGTVVAGTTVAGTTARATTAAATTTGAGGSTAPATTTATCVPATAAPVQVPCSISCCPLTVGRTALVFTLSTNYDAFNCPAFMAEASGALRSSTFKICGYRRGSTIIDVDVTSAEADAVFAAGALPSPVTDFVSVVDPATARAVAAPGGVPLLIIVVIVVLAVLLAIVLIVLCCCIRRRRRLAAKQHKYASVPRSEPVTHYTTFAAAAPASSVTHVSVGYVPPAAPGLVCMQVMHDVEDVADGVLKARRGDICFVEGNDLATAGDWIWVRIGHQQGYVPRSKSFPTPPSQSNPEATDYIAPK